MRGASGQQRRGPYRKYSMADRAAAVIKYIQCGCSKAALAPALLSTGFAKSAKQCANAARAAARWFRNFKKTGTVAELPRPGRPHRLPRAVALTAGNLLVDGQEVQVPNPQGGMMTVRVPFPDMTLALALSPPLLKIMRDYGLSRRALIRAITEADPRIQYLPLYVKRKFSDADKLERQRVAQQLLQQPASWFRNIIYIDETKMVVFGTENPDINVWRRVSDDNPGALLLHVGGRGFAPFKLHFLAAVNAQVGLLGWQLTTGSTHLGQTLMRDPLPGTEIGTIERTCYKVSWPGRWKHMQPSGAVVRVAPGSWAQRCSRNHQGWEVRPRATAKTGSYAGVSTSSGLLHAAVRVRRAKPAAATAAAPPPARSAWCTLTTAAPARHSAVVFCRSFCCCWVAGVVCIVVEKCWLPSTSRYVPVAGWKKSATGKVLPASMGQYCHRHSAAMATLGSSSYIARSSWDGRSRLARRKTMSLQQNLHSSCEGLRTALGVHMRRCRPHVSAKSTCTPSVYIPTSSHTPSLKHQGMPLSSQASWSPEPRCKESNHHSSRRCGTRARPPAQTAAGQVAKAVTAGEFGDFMYYIKSRAAELQAAGRLGPELVYSFDNARPYNFWAAGKSAYSQPWPGLVRAPLPSKSPDVHKEIEHTFGRFKHFFRELVYMEVAGMREQQLTDARLQVLLHDALRRAAAPESLQRDLDSLRVTLEVVARAKGSTFVTQLHGHMYTCVGSGGDWPSQRHLR